MQLRFSGYCSMDTLFLCQAVQIVLVDEHQSLSQAGVHASRTLGPVRAKVTFDHNGGPATIHLEIAKTLGLDLRFNRNSTERAREYAILASNAFSLMDSHSVSIGVQATRRTRFDARCINAVVAGDRGRHLQRADKLQTRLSRLPRNIVSVKTCSQARLAPDASVRVCNNEFPCVHSFSFPPNF